MMPPQTPTSRPGRVQIAFADTLVANLAAPVNTARNGHILTYEGDFADHGILLTDGWLALSKSLAGGETQIIDVMLPGDFGLIGAKDAPISACTVEALSDIRYITIRPPMVNGPDPASAKLREVLAAAILTTQSRTSEMLLRLGRGNAASRVAFTLIEFHTRLHAVGRTNGTIFEFPITQQKLGEITGLTNVHVCRTLRRLERDGIIAHPDSRSIELLDIPALCDLAGIDLDMFRAEILIQDVAPALG
ncbi:Crp/Fnr family transcriptional regulator [Pseudorhodobacter aquimaris]|uniref:Crp/Fnr family transcriptional regulator n=1 Tax=Pseudorhodobacter aquimaris TaxID=687412 RepID=UPI00067BB28A|nr:Crp/Fnr family transcriptional regulator [Pseudorhodobacter aquimaris]